MSERRLAAIMFTDIVGYTALMGSDEDKAFKVLTENREIHSKLIEQFNGTLIKEMGDGMLISFNLASEAVRCAIEIQKACNAHDIPLKIGIHEGEMVFEGADVLGDGVNIASRVQEDAPEGCIIISGSVYRDIKNKASIKAEFLKEKRFKNVDEPIRVYKVYCEEDEPVINNSKQPTSRNLVPYFVLAGLAIVIAIMLLWKFLPSKNQESSLTDVVLDKSIAVLPFINDSPDEEKMYFINGTMEAILVNLCKIEDLRVPGRTSVEQYRDNPKPISVVAEEMNVSYVLEGSGHRDGNNVRLFVQLLDGKNDKHIWSKSYNADIAEIFFMQSEIAQLVADEIQAVITPKEKELIENIPTSSLTAYDFYQRGSEELLSNRWDLKALDKAEEFFNKALSYDSTYGQPYLGLATVYRQKNISAEYLSDNYLDSAIVLVNIALSYDNTLADAYVFRGDYYRDKGYSEQAIKEYDRALNINPNSWEAYWNKSYVYKNEDPVAAIDNMHKAITINRGRERFYLLILFGVQVAQGGFFEIGRMYVQKGLELSDNSNDCNRFLADIETLAGNWEEAAKCWRKNNLADTSLTGRLFELGCIYGYIGKYTESLLFLDKWLATHDELLFLDGQYSGMHRVGYAYWKNNRFDEAKYYFDLQIEYCNRIIEKDFPHAQKYFTYYDKAGIYAFRGEREKAFENLRIFNQQKIIQAWLYQLIKIDPLFDSIRDEPEFQQIVRDVEAKYQAEHERVRQWLEENDML